MYNPNWDEMKFTELILRYEEYKKNIERYFESIKNCPWDFWEVGNYNREEENNG